MKKTILLSICFSLLLIDSTLFFLTQYRKKFPHIPLNQNKIVLLKNLAEAKKTIELKIQEIDPLLPEIFTTRIDFLEEDFRRAVVINDYSLAQKVLGEIEGEAEFLLSRQEEIAEKEKERLIQQIEENITQGKEIFASTGELERRFSTLKEVAYQRSVRENLETLRALLIVSAEILAQRRAEMSMAVKSILIRQSEKSLYLYEGDRLVYSMSISLGRRGNPTRNGEFKILDKYEKIWGYYRIWMPYWMGIYFAGSSENGIHGIPWDSSGRRYWEDDIGVRNVTYGCVMPNDEDARKLYNWAEIGIPVTIVN